MTAQSGRRPAGSQGTRRGGGKRATIPPQARPFQGARAGIVSRTLAGCVDVAVAALILAGVYAVVAAARFLWSPRTFHFPAPSYGLLLAVGAVILAIDLVTSWATIGRTYGDRLLGLRVVDHAGRHPGVALAALRALLCVLFPIGLFWATVSRENRSAQDVVLRTSVVYDWGLGNAAHAPHAGRRSKP